MKFKENDIGNLLKELDLNALGLSSKLVDEAIQVEVAFEALGIIRQTLIEHNLDSHLNRFDKMLEKKLKKVREKTLFPNAIGQDNFAISSVISDPHAKLLEKDSEFLQQSYENGKIINIKYGNGKQVYLGHKSIRPNYFNGSLSEFLDTIQLWQDPRIVQHWCCLWNWACKNQSFFFPYVPITEILETVYTASKEGKFSMKVRKSFSMSLDFFHNATIECPVMIEEIKNSGKKKKEKALRMFRLLDLSLAKKSKKTGTYLKVAGQLLPGLNPSKFRGRVFPKGIFALDANKDGNRILLAYKICNRLDQINGKPLEWSLDHLIQAAGLDKSYRNNRSYACNILSRSLNRLKKVKCIDAFQPEKISIKTPKILIYPNISS